MERASYKKTIVDVLIITFLILFPHFASLPFASYAVIGFLVVVVYLKRQNKTLDDLGLKRKGLTLHTFIIGILSASLWIAFIKFFYFPFINHFFKNYVKAYTDFDSIKNNIVNLLILLVVAWIGAGFYEEIVFRGFIQRSLQKWFVKYKRSFWFAGVLTSILFGLYHWQQGIFGVIPATIVGLYWTYLLKRYNANLWYPIISHAMYDTIALTMIYLGIFNN